MLVIWLLRTQLYFLSGSGDTPKKNALCENRLYNPAVVCSLEVSYICKSSKQMVVHERIFAL